MKNNFKKVLCGILVAVFATVSFGASVSAASMSMSPLVQDLILNPGETVTDTFTISNPGTSTDDLEFVVEVRPFSADENGEVYYGEKESWNQMIDWTTIDVNEGILAPNNSVSIEYTISVPEDAPAGGQYMAIVVSSKVNDDEGSGTVNLGESIGMAYLVFAEVSGNVDLKGEIIENDVPSLVFSGGIKASTTIKNTGNVYGTAKYTMKVFPLFSDEEVFTNEENPETGRIINGATRRHETVWAETPTFGIFNVEYTAEFAGASQTITKMVIVCPIWLMFIVIFGIMILIFWLIARSKAKRKQ
ncbi:MAG: hypothetical protein Q4B29_00695 [Candidatus Saccharibacteria bacterium]|nr:hypothetical protein [Candidatus Saccharibacteria bacterium]